jgi:MerR family transcriptional regulator, thiopeptide resistance regulator
VRPQTGLVKTRRTYQVKDVARIAGVSIRTLHHYDEIKLLVPRTRTRAGYRLYRDDDLLRLQQILIGRELGLPLEEIRRSLDDPGFDRRKALLAQKKQLLKRAGQTKAMIRAIDVALEVLNGKSKEGSTDMKEIFGGFDPTRYEEEARERWGNTDAYKESMKRTKRYTREDWKTIQTEQSAIYKDAFAAMKAGKKPADAAVTAIAERHRLSIDRWYYPCNTDAHRGLASLYESDSRFAASIDSHGEGLTPFLVAAIRANASSRDKSVKT